MSDSVSKVGIELLGQLKTRRNILALALWDRISVRLCPVGVGVWHLERFLMRKVPFMPRKTDPWQPILMFFGGCQILVLKAYWVPDRWALGPN